MPLRETGRSLVLLFARVTLGALFLYAGWRMIGDVDGIAGKLAPHGYPMPKILAVVAALAQLGGGASLVLGGFTTFGCLALILFLIPTTWSFHWPQARAGDVREIIEMLKNLAILGGVLALAVAGPGGLSLDRRRKGGR